MEKIGDIETSTIQEVAVSLAARYGLRDGSADVGRDLTIKTKRERFSSDVRIFDNGRLVFAAKAWIDGDQLVRTHRRGRWQDKLLSVRA